jgi:thioesterase domain-containing protein
MQTAEELEQRIREGIPIAAQMAFRVCDLQPNSITVTAGCDENINVHGTAFAGSIYTICTLALWGLVTARLPEGATLVLSESNIRYRQPVLGEIDAYCKIEHESFESFLTKLHQLGRSHLQANVVVPGIEGAAAEYNGTVFARLGRALK